MKLGKYISVTALLISAFLWVKALSMQQASHRVISDLQMAVFHQLTFAETKCIEAAMIAGLIFSAIALVATVLLLSSVASLFYKRSLLEAGVRLAHRYAGSFALMPLFTVSIAWEAFICTQLPSKTPSLFMQCVKIEPILSLISKYDGILLYLTIMSVLGLFFLRVYGGVDLSVWSNRLCLPAGLLCGYSVLYKAIAHFEYGVWFLALIFVFYTVIWLPLIVIMIVVCRNAGKRFDKPLLGWLWQN